MKKTKCLICNNHITNNNFQKHLQRCETNTKLTCYMRKANNLDVYSKNNQKHKIDDLNWIEIQKYYDSGVSVKEVCQKYDLNFNLMSKAVKLNYFVSRSSKDTRSIKNDKGSYLRYKHSKESISKIKKSMRLAVIEGRQKTPSPYGKKMKIYKMNNSLDGTEEILHCSWEKRVAECMTRMKIKWCKPRNSFTYIHNDSEHEYFPDFYLPEYDLYIEVKGYKTNRDLDKWKNFPKRLIIIDKHCMSSLDNFLQTQL